MATYPDNIFGDERRKEDAARGMLAALETLDEGLALSERLCGLSAGAKKQQAMIRAAIAAAKAAGITSKEG